MYVDQSRQQRLASGFDGIGAKRLGIGRRTRVDFGDLAVLDQHGTLIDHGAVAQKQARVANQGGAAPLGIAAQNFGLGDIGLGVHLVCTQHQKRTQYGEQPKLRCRPQLLFLFPAEQLHREKRGYQSRQCEGARRGQIVEDRFLASQNGLQSAIEVCGRDELCHGLEPNGKDHDRNRDSAQKQHGEIEKLDYKRAFLHGVDQRRDDAADGSERQ